MKTIKILFQGDSVTDEERDRNDPHHLGKGYAKFAAQRLKEVFPQKQLEFLNLGISGNKSGDLLERWEKDCIAVQPNIVCFMIGINDVWHSYAHGLDITTEEYSENCRRMLEALKSKTKAGLVVMEPFLLDNPEKPFREKLDPNIDAIRALSREYADILVPLDGMMTAALPIQAISASVIAPARQTTISALAKSSGILYMYFLTVTLPFFKVSLSMSVKPHVRYKAACSS